MDMSKYCCTTSTIKKVNNIKKKPSQKSELGCFLMNFVELIMGVPMICNRVMKNSVFYTEDVHQNFHKMGPKTFFQS